MAVNELPEMPNGPVMELHGQRKRFHVPHGLKPLLEELTREILRYQPNDIYGFLSQLMESKVAKREQANAKQRSKGSVPRWNSLEGPDILNNDELTEFLGDLNITKNEADKHATKIQALFRGHKARKSLIGKKLLAPKKIEKRWNSLEGPDILDKAELTEFLGDLNITKIEADKHATKIQALFRGHKARKSLTGKGLLAPKEPRKSLEGSSAIEGEPKAPDETKAPEDGPNATGNASEGRKSLDEGPKTSEGRKSLDEGPKTSEVRKTLDEGPKTSEGRKSLDEGPKTSEGRKSLDEGPKTSEVRKTLDEGPKTSEGRKSLDEGPKTSEVRKTLEEGPKASNGRKTLDEGPNTLGDDVIKVIDEGPKTVEGP